MYRTMYTSKSGMIANQTKLETISNNIANNTTHGYKRVDVGFQDLLNESINRKGVPTSPNSNSIMGTGVKTSEWVRDNTQGNLIASTKMTDLAIDGVNCYFQVYDGEGNTYYTRDGSFAVDKLGHLVDNRGNKVSLNFLNGNTEDSVKFKEDNFAVDSQGGIYISDNGTLTKVAEIPVYTALGNDAFVSVGDNLFVPAEGSNVVRTTDAGIHQGYLEGSNVDLAQEMTDMIVTQRAFQLCSKGVTTADEMWGMINKMR